MSLSAEEILGSGQRLQCVRVSTPEWSKTRDKKAHVWVRELRGNEIDRVQPMLAMRQEGKIDEKDVLGVLCILCVCNEKQEALFKADDLPRLLAGPLMPLRRCAEKALAIAGLTDEAVEDLEKNSASGPTG